jgi:hypothetical protein
VDRESTIAFVVGVRRPLNVPELYGPFDSEAAAAGVRLLLLGAADELGRPLGESDVWVTDLTPVAVPA